MDAQVNRIGRPLRTQPVQVIAVTSGKGGVGKTTVSINLAIALAGLSREVLLLDADLGLANVDVMLGMRPTKNLSHVLDGVCDIGDIVLDGPSGIKIVPASSGVRHMADLSPAQHAGLIHAFSSLGQMGDTLIIDTSAGVSDTVIRFCVAAQEVLVVVCNEPASIADAYAMIKILHQDHHIQRFRVLVNMVESAKEACALFEKLLGVTQRFLNVSLDYMGMVPFDSAVRKAIQKQKALLSVSPNSPAGQEYKRLAARASKWPLPQVASGKLEFFVERMIGVQSMGVRASL